MIVLFLPLTSKQQNSLDLFSLSNRSAHWNCVIIYHSVLNFPVLWRVRKGYFFFFVTNEKLAWK